MFPLPKYFAPPLPIPLELGNSAGDQKCEWWGNWAKNKFDNNFHLRDRWMDRQKDTGWQQKPRLHVASRG